MSLVSVSGGSKLLSPLLVTECVVYELSPHKVVIRRQLSIVIMVLDVDHLPMILNKLQDSSANLGSVIVNCSQGPGIESRIPNSRQKLVK